MAGLSKAVVAYMLNDLSSTSCFHSTEKNGGTTIIEKTFDYDGKKESEEEV
jgi:hypothetical protein